jgi:hypothetical protein
VHVLERDLLLKKERKEKDDLLFWKETHADMKRRFRISRIEIALSLFWMACPFFEKKLYVVRLCVVYVYWSRADMFCRIQCVKELMCSVSSSFWCCVMLRLLVLVSSVKLRQSHLLSKVNTFSHAHPKKQQKNKLQPKTVVNHTPWSASTLLEPSSHSPQPIIPSITLSPPPALIPKNPNSLLPYLFIYQNPYTYITFWDLRNDRHTHLSSK